MKSRLDLPNFETSCDAIHGQIEKLIQIGKSKIQEIGDQAPDQTQFASTLGALDDLNWSEGCVLHRIHLLHNVSPDENIRKAAQEAIIQFQTYAIERSYDPKVYQAVKAYSAKGEKLDPEAEKLLQESLRDFKRLGLDLASEKQMELKRLQKELSELETQFSSAINEFHDEILLSKSEVEGLDQDFLKGLKQSNDGLYRISLQYPEFLPTMEFAKSEEVRRELLIKKYNTAAAVNTPRLTQMIQLRRKIAGILGYASWNDYVIEERMAKKPEAVRTFLLEVETRLKAKGKAELEALAELKRSETKDPNAQIFAWDYSYYSSLYKKKNFEVDTRSLKEFFPLENVLKGFFNLVETLFDLRFKEIPKGSFDSWHPDVRLFKVLSADSQDIGAFFLDLFPRQGKYGHAAAFGLIEGKLRSDGTYQRPVKAMVCNFNPEAPHLLTHSEVETLFHEFGHILHGVLTWAKFAKFSGTSVAWDFVEAPSQVLENWAWDLEILNMVSKHTKDPSAKISRDLVERMNRAQKAGMGLFYLRQLSFAKADLRLHGTEAVLDPIAVINQVIGESFIPVPEGTAFGAGFGHLVGYASGYYGYAWADVMAADMFSLFKKHGLLNKELGIKLRKEIYEPGSSRDENTSLTSFLGRPLSYDAFFESIGAAA